MRRMTIIDACVEALKCAGDPLAPNDLFDRIQTENLYDFKAKDPIGVMRSSLRRHIRNERRPRLTIGPDGRYRLA